MRFMLHDNYFRDASAQHWLGEFLEVEEGAELSLLAPDGSTRVVRIEIDQGDVRLRLWNDASVSDAPAGEMVLKPGCATATLEAVE